MSLKKVNGNYYISVPGGCMCLGANPTLNPPSPTEFDWDDHYKKLDQQRKREHGGKGSVRSAWFNTRDVKLYL